MNQLKLFLLIGFATCIGVFTGDICVRYFNARHSAVQTLIINPSASTEFAVKATNALTVNFERANWQEGHVIFLLVTNASNFTLTFTDVDEWLPKNPITNKWAKLTYFSFVKNTGRIYGSYVQQR